MLSNCISSSSSPTSLFLLNSCFIYKCKLYVGLLRLLFISVWSVHKLLNHLPYRHILSPRVDNLLGFLSCMFKCFPVFLVILPMLLKWILFAKANFSEIGYLIKQPVNICSVLSCFLNLSGQKYYVNLLWPFLHSNTDLNAVQYVSLFDKKALISR